MCRIKYIGFKGEKNTSCILTRYLSESPYLLTNSSGGIRKDIELLDNDCDFLVMFGVDKNLKDIVRIEAVAEMGRDKLTSNLDLSAISTQLSDEGIANYLCDKPSHYLCNEAYWLVLRKFGGNAVFIHIPSIKNMNSDFLEKMKKAVG